MHGLSPRLTNVPLRKVSYLGLRELLLPNSASLQAALPDQSHFSSSDNQASSLCPGVPTGPGTSVNVATYWKTSALSFQMPLLPALLA